MFKDESNHESICTAESLENHDAFKDQPTTSNSNGHRVVELKVELLGSSENKSGRFQECTCQLTDNNIIQIGSNENPSYDSEIKPLLIHLLKKVDTVIDKLQIMNENVEKIATFIDKKRF